MSRSTTSRVRVAAVAGAGVLATVAATMGGGAVAGDTARDTADDTARLATSVTIVSRGINDQQGNDNSDRAATNLHGRYVAFTSEATNLLGAGNDSNGSPDVFLRDRSNGTTKLMSRSLSGGPGNGLSIGSDISDDGRYVVFDSAASDLVAFDQLGFMDVFVRDATSASMRLVSVSRAGGNANSGSAGSVISGNGRYVAFYSFATDLVANDANGQADVFVRDLGTNTTRRVSVDSAGRQVNGDSSMVAPAISANGRYVAFVSDATDLVANDTNGQPDVFLRDTVARTTRRISVGMGGVPGNDTSGLGSPSISADGRYIAFVSAASNLVPDDTAAIDVFVRDRVAGTTVRASVSSTEQQANQSSGPEIAISGSGTRVAFTSIASNLDVTDPNGFQPDAFVRDLTAGTTVMVSRPPAPPSGIAGSQAAFLSTDGSRVGFVSTASDLVANDTNGTVADVFTRAVPTG
jgi:Tol biopolymer transport system component